MFPDDKSQEEIESIDDWVNDVSQMIQDYELIARYISYTHKTVPAIGLPGSNITGYFIQYEVVEEGETYLEEMPLFIENNYNHAGYSAIECYYYTMEGEPVYCISTLFDGFEIGCDYTDKFYFREGEAFYYISGTGETFTNLNEDDVILARSRLQHAESLLSLFMDLYVPAPYVFWERWGEYW